ncbi:acyl-CoA thioesterase [Actinomadura fibrosa]|uniref:Acyl-CoA thioesterase n=1 Tax=Actinomadura fibrosa TaxID=111802 RepID=A0ABW2XIT4_9ACTN|nr:acyl-CoA thioesterase domain-containing protein [Actinomadura fibrosa]
MTGTDLWSDLLDCLELRGESPAFEGRNQRLSYHRLFGGQLLAQFVRVASLAHPEKAVKSLHVLFPRAGRSDELVRYEVERHHEGGTFATAGIVARQSRGVIATASVSLHAAEDGLDHQTTEPVPAVLGAEHRVDLDLVPWEVRSAADLDSRKPEPPEASLWMRTPPAAPELAPALTAYATDLTLIGTALRPLDGIGQRDAGTAFTSAVTSHTLWFHRPFRTDGWLLLRQHGPLLAHGRCFGRGDVLAEDGSLVASYAQEALVRFAG